MRQIELTDEDASALLIMLGYATGAAMKQDPDLAKSFLRLTNTVGKQYPNFRPYEIEAKAPEGEQKDRSILNLAVRKDLAILQRDNWRKIAEGLAKSATAMRIALSDIYRDGHTVRIQLTKAGALNHEVVGLLITAAGRDYGDMEAQSAYNKAKAEAGR